MWIYIILHEKDAALFYVYIVVVHSIHPISYVTINFANSLRKVKFDYNTWAVKATFSIIATKLIFNFLLVQFEILKKAQ